MVQRGDTDVRVQLRPLVQIKIQRIIIRVSYYILKSHNIHSTLLVRLGYYWKKTELKWALTKNPTVMTTARAKDAIKAACNKWAARSRFTFKEAASNEIVRTNHLA